jgi:glycosyltransferase involved in cell wall biosynthesis
MVVHSFYPADPRVRREAEALRDDGWAVDVVCLRGSREAATEVCDGVRVHRLPVDRHRGSGLAVYLLEYLAFFSLAFFKVALLHLRNRYSVVQSHNMPDFLVFVGLVPRLTGARVVHDMHDLVPELFSVRFAGRENHPGLRATRLVERAATAFADHVITVSEVWRQRLIKRARLSPEKITVVMNAADPKLFTPEAPRPRREGGEEQFLLAYHGGLYERTGVDVAIRAVAKLRGQIPGLRFRVFGTGETEAALRRLIADLNLEETVSLAGFVPLERIPAAIAQADLGIVPHRKNPFMDELYPTKVFEYLAMGVPVITSRTTRIAEFFGTVEDMFFGPEDEDDLARLILALYREPQRRQAMLAAAQATYEPYRWERQRARYLSRMARLVTPTRVVPQAEGDRAA